MNRERYLDSLDALEISTPEINFEPIDRVKLAITEHILRRAAIVEAKNRDLSAIHAVLREYHTLVLLGVVDQSAHSRLRSEAYELGGFQHLNQQED